MLKSSGRKAIKPKENLRRRTKQKNNIFMKILYFYQNKKRKELLKDLPKKENKKPLNLTILKHYEKKKWKKEGCKVLH